MLTKVQYWGGDRWTLTDSCCPAISLPIYSIASYSATAFMYHKNFLPVISNVIRANQLMNYPISYRDFGNFDHNLNDLFIFRRNDIGMQTLRSYYLQYKYRLRESLKDYKPISY